MVRITFCRTSGPPHQEFLAKAGLVAAALVSIKINEKTQAFVAKSKEEELRSNVEEMQRRERELLEKLAEKEEEINQLGRMKVGYNTFSISVFLNFSQRQCIWKT